MSLLENIMAGYTRDFLIQAYVSRYEPLGLEAVESLYKLAEAAYDRYGKDKFRAYASLDAETLRKYKAK
jgi:hypothetical protein